MMVKSGTEGALRAPGPHDSTPARMHKRAHVGLSAEQVTAAIGQPLSKQTVPTVAGATEVWSYTTHRVTLRNGVVTGIIRTQRP